MKKFIPSQATLGTVSIEKSIDSVIRDIMRRFSLNLFEDEISTLISYLAYFNYYTFEPELFTYKDQLIAVVYSTDGRAGYIKFDQTQNTIVFIEDTIITDFTNKERTNVVYTSEGKVIIYTFNDFNTAIVFNTKSSKRIKILSDRSLRIPKDLEPDDVKDFSKNPSDFYKLLEESNYAKVTKLNHENKHQILT